MKILTQQSPRLHLVSSFSNFCEIFTYSCSLLPALNLGSHGSRRAWQRRARPCCRLASTVTGQDVPSRRLPADQWDHARRRRLALVTIAVGSIVFEPQCLIVIGLPLDWPVPSCRSLGWLLTDCSTYARSALLKLTLYTSTRSSIMLSSRNSVSVVISIGVCPSRRRVQSNDRHEHLNALPKTCTY